MAGSLDQARRLAERNGEFRTIIEIIVVGIRNRAVINKPFDLAAQCFGSLDRYDAVPLRSNNRHRLINATGICGDFHPVRRSSRTGAHQ